MNLFDLSLKFNGFPIRKAKLALKAIQEIDDDEFEAYVDQKKNEIVSYHLEHSDYYKNIVKGFKDSNWSSVPVMTKRDLQKPLNDRISQNFNTKNIYVNKTSGSSGDPFIFAKDKYCHALTWAVIIDRFNWYNLNFNRSKQARFYGIPLDSMGYYKERLKMSSANAFGFQFSI